jgi:HD-GYP domain-containing protein (c-di-GMP phosphodiesterase class II)
MNQRLPTISPESSQYFAELVHMSRNLVYNIRSRYPDLFDDYATTYLEPMTSTHEACQIYPPGIILVAAVTESGDQQLLQLLASLPVDYESWDYPLEVILREAMKHLNDQFENEYGKLNKYMESQINYLKNNSFNLDEATCIFFHNLNIDNLNLNELRLLNLRINDNHLNAAITSLIKHGESLIQQIDQFQSVSFRITLTITRIHLIQQNKKTKRESVKSNVVPQVIHDFDEEIMMRLSSSNNADPEVDQEFKDISIVKIDKTPSRQNIRAEMRMLDSENKMIRDLQRILNVLDITLKLMEEYQEETSAHSEEMSLILKGFYSYLIATGHLGSNDLLSSHTDPGYDQSEFQAGLQSEVEKIRMHDMMLIALLHDIGKLMSLPLSILRKSRKPSNIEWSTCNERHTIFGYQLIIEVIGSDLRDLPPRIKVILGCVLFHHYPRYPKPDQMNSEVQAFLNDSFFYKKYREMLELVDIYQSLVAERPYKRVFSPAEALRIMEEDVARGAFEEELLKLFERYLKDYVYLDWQNNDSFFHRPRESHGNDLTGIPVYPSFFSE